jgi:glycine oxidase
MTGAHARNYDVIVAGGGLIGATIAWQLSREDLRVALFDAGEPGNEASWASAGILSPAPENPGMISAVSLAKASMALYPEFIAEVEQCSGINTGYRAKGTIEAITSSSAREELSTIIALHRGLGLRAEPLSPQEAREMEPALSEEVEAAVLRPEEASVDNRLFTRAALEAAKRCGAEILANRRVQAIRAEGSRCTGVTSAGENFSSGHTVIAAGAFSAQIAGAAQFAPVHPAKGQMVSLRCEAAKIERVLWGEHIYLVPRDDGRILAGATVEHVGFDKTATAGGLQTNLSAAIALAPVLATARIEETWAGLRPDSPDHLPIIGSTDLEGLHIATGHFRSGILLAPVTAKVICEIVSGKTPGVDCERFSPLRFRRVADHTAASSARS